MTRYDDEDNNVDYWEALSLIQEAEVLMESSRVEDMLEAAEALELSEAVLDTMELIDVRVPLARIKRARAKLEAYFT